MTEAKPLLEARQVFKGFFGNALNRFLACFYFL